VRSKHFPAILSGVILCAGLCSLPHALAAQTRIENNDPSIAYSGTWYANTSSSNFNSTAALTNFKGAQAVLTFKGTGVTWIGILDPGNGIAYVYLDGVMTTVDCYGPSTVYQQQMFAAHNLANGTHTLSIYVPHVRDPNGSGSWVWIDSFLIDNGSGVTGGNFAGAGMVFDNNPALNYTGYWFTNSTADPSAGTVALATDANSAVSINFNGTGITWLAYRDQYSGIANVFLDGQMVATVDTYLSPAQSQTPAWSISGLAMNAHTLTIQVTGTHDSASSDSWVWVDGFNVTGPAGAPPTVNTNGVVNAASFAPAPNNQVAPGQIISIFGNNFLPSGQVSSTSIPLATTLGAANLFVTACGQNIPLFTATPAQINAQIPWQCPASGTTAITVSSGGQTSAAQNITLAAASPAIFTEAASGTGPGAILHADNSLVSTSSPARGGETVAIYGTGLGPTTPAFSTGAAASGSNKTVNTVTASVGGRAATVVFSGLSAGLVGLYQVNAVMPSGLSGTQVVTISVNGATSPASVTLFAAP